VGFKVFGNTTATYMLPDLTCDKSMNGMVLISSLLVNASSYGLFVENPLVILKDHWTYCIYLILLFCF
jgi:hypothetical protein